MAAILHPRVNNLHTLQQLQSGELASTEPAITRLQLAENLTQFPVEIFDLADSLEILDLSGNKLSRLPADFGRLKHLRILFLSNNQFDHVPEVLAQCPKLEMIGFKANHIKTVAEDCLPVQTRWLILTDNKIEKLPDSMGQLYRLQKLALAGNLLTELPSSMANCRNLELARLSANSLTSLPDWLFQLPKMSWLAFAGNAFNKNLTDAPMVKVNMASIQLNHQIGEGASGVIHHANWVKQPASLKGVDAEIAVKLFKGEVTSDGYPQDELNCCLSAGDHPNLIKVVAKIDQKNQLGLVMKLIPESFYNLGLPPSLVSCTRDTFNEGTAFTPEQITKIAFSMADILNYLHAKQVSHGDVYAHNTMIDDQSSVLFGDFGAASDLSVLPKVQREAMESVEVRAFACLLEDLLSLNSEQYDSSLISALTDLKNTCMHEDTVFRPRLNEIKNKLQSLLVQPELEFLF
jgi:tRNA A-37 threonylcarbamoyl transferase component Bud32